MIVDTDNITGKGFFHILAVLSHEYSGIGKSNLFSDPVVEYLHSPAEFSGADPDKSDSVPVGRVHVGLDFEGKS